MPHANVVPHLVHEVEVGELHFVVGSEEHVIEFHVGVDKTQRVHRVEGEE